MSHWIIAPILLPALCGALMLVLGDQRIALQRALAVPACTAFAALAAALVIFTAGGEIGAYHIGNWPAPYGIVLVLDRLAALMLALTAIVALAGLLEAMRGVDRQGRHFHALFQFQLMGLNGAFLAGDLFNLFVFFEVLLVASYCLLVHGLTATRVRAGLHYVVINLAASLLFLIGISLLYGVAGTLNLTDLAVRVPALASVDLPLARTAALLLFVVFAVKAAMFPLYFWLPGTYAAAAGPVAAVFAVLAKVGVYAIVRVHGVVFGPDAGQVALVAKPWLIAGALLTAVLGTLGAVAARRFGTMVANLTVGSMGTILIAVSAFSVASLSAAFYYMAHSTLVVAALFLYNDALGKQRGTSGDALEPAAPLAQVPTMGILFTLAGAAIAGIPPFSGFIGKAMILQSTSGLTFASLLWAVILGTGFLSIITLARAGSLLFWKTLPASPQAPAADGTPLSPMLFLLACGMVLVVFASPVKRYTDAAAAPARRPISLYPGGARRCHV